MFTRLVRLRTSVPLRVFRVNKIINRPSLINPCSPPSSACGPPSVSINIYILLIAGHLWQLQTTNHQLFFLNSNYLQYNGNLKKFFLSIAVQLMTIAVSPQNRPPADLRVIRIFRVKTINNQSSVISNQSSVISHQ